ncbi:HAD family hydrolase [Vibrio sinensis]|uniref:HAD family hydrolase n=1 Tax=Vibrio sinensis TaxID=2302434 RepID=A0A3A6QCN0_9VIBR|nr:HAD family hydrolase [Vibrio sinensis]RJX70026.1 HAD family hydrolase [Vibrio sinensis]
MPKSLYVFDMDDTLINGDCAVIWNEFLVSKGIANQANFLEEDRRLMSLYAQGKMNMEDYLQFAMTPLRNIPVEQVKAWVDECVEHCILPRLFPQAKQRIEELTRDGCDMLVISATVTFLVATVAKRIGITNALGIDLKQKNGIYTSEILGVPSYREGKVTRLEAWRRTQAQAYAPIHFYSDSINDLSLCQYADFTYLVNPCPRLREHADQPNWIILNWG